MRDTIASYTEMVMHNSAADLIMDVGGWVGVRVCVYGGRSGNFKCYYVLTMKCKQKQVISPILSLHQCGPATQYFHSSVR